MGKLEKIEEMLRDEPGDTFLLYSRGLELLKLGRATDGLAQLRELIASQPDYVPAYFRLGQALVEDDQIPEAREALEAGIVVGRRVGDQHAVGEMSTFLDTLND